MRPLRGAANSFMAEPTYTTTSSRSLSEYECRALLCEPVPQSPSLIQVHAPDSGKLWTLGVRLLRENCTSHPRGGALARPIQPRWMDGLFAFLSTEMHAPEVAIRPWQGVTDLNSGTKQRRLMAKAQSRVP